MSDPANDLAAWFARGQAMIAALPPIDDDVDRRITAALNKAHGGYVRRKLGKRA